MEKIYSLKEKVVYIVLILLLLVIAIVLVLNFYNIIPKKYYLASDFDVKLIKSSVDYDDDGIDDYTDFVLGARKDAENHPTYISKYYEDVYPPDYEGVCTDVIWRAFKEAGYSLRHMMNYDITNNIDDYEMISKVDNKIDFRRVYNQKVFFDKYAVSLTLDPYDIDEWQPGDIVFFNSNHVGIISDKRNKKGVAYVIHNAGQPVREEDYLTKKKITGHYRFDASKVSKKVLSKWNEEED